uniref:hypothetical protein n=1 Tax=uncultured Rhizobium sp. TaxID=155567 RepID=UPI00260821E7|nr:hypothetical protein [uncultured Rhizobium sp.]
MTTKPNSNILVFPLGGRTPEPVRPSPDVDCNPCPPNPDETTGVSTAAACDDHAAHATAVMRAAIAHARRKGVRLESLPPQLRTWLLDLCEAGDPACRMVLDWLNGNKHYDNGQHPEDR